MNLKGLASTFFLAAFVLVAVFYLPEASSQGTPDINCRITTGSPSSDERIIFTFQNGTGGNVNAHGARPTGIGAFTHRVVCTNFTTSSFAQGDLCPETESGVLSFSNYTNSHVETYDSGSYGWQACGRSENPDTGVNELSCVVRATSCRAFEAELVSFQNSAGGAANAHVGVPGTYNNRLCCSLRCTGASCIIVRTPAPEVFSPTGEYATFDVELFNRDGENTVRVELYLTNWDQYNDSQQYGRYGSWEFLFTNESGDFYPAQTTIAPKATKLLTFKVRPPVRAPPSTGLAPYKFFVRVRDV